MLPEHGWIGCGKCFKAPEVMRHIGVGVSPAFRIEQPNGAWGARDPLVVILGFSRGSRQDPSRSFDDVAFAGMRNQLTQIMRALGLLGDGDHVDNRIRAGESDIHFGSLFRCSVAMWDKKKQDYAKSGNGILEKFLASKETREVAEACTGQFLGALPGRTKLVMLMGNSPDYVEQCMRLLQRLHPAIRRINEVAYGDGRVTWVHSIHAKAQGRHIPEWLSGADTAVGRKLEPARTAVTESGVLQLLRRCA